MCGIAGVFSQGKADAASVQTMCSSLAHRGPDDSGIVELADGRLILGHRRLSILDLSPLGHQPMSTADRSLWTVFNGEIYNFREIRAELEALGHRFRSDSDTEVLLAAYRAWGTDSVQRFRGMFAYALWDEARRELHLVRDRFGVKPLYYGVRGGALAFASELRALNVAGFTARDPDAAAVTDFLQYGYVSAPRSIFADVRTVEPGTILTFGANLEPRVRRYWSLTELYDSPEQLALRRRARIDARRGAPRSSRARAHRSVSLPHGRRRARWALFLSGGIDSSLVATRARSPRGRATAYFHHRLRQFRIRRDPIMRAKSRSASAPNTPNSSCRPTKRCAQRAPSRNRRRAHRRQLADPHAHGFAAGAPARHRGACRPTVPTSCSADTRATRCACAFAERLKSAARLGYYLGASCSSACRRRGRRAVLG